MKILTKEKQKRLVALIIKAHESALNNDLYNVTCSLAQIAREVLSIEQLRVLKDEILAKKDEILGKKDTEMDNKYVIKEILNMGFKYSGAEGIFVFDRVAFKDKFDKNGSNNWEKSSGKKKLQEWAEKNLTKEILEQFEVDLPTADEVFSQKILNLYKSSRDLQSKRFPIFQNSDNRMMEFDGKPIWWWTKTATAGYVGIVWSVDAYGSIEHNNARATNGFVPILRKKK